MQSEIVTITDEIDAHLTKSERLRFMNHSVALRYARSAAELAESQGDVHRYGLALKYITWCYGALNENERALTYAIEGLKLAREFNLPDIEAEMVGAVGHCYYRIGILDDARHLFEHQYVLGQQLDDPLIMVTALIDQAAPKTVTKDYCGAAEALERALALMSDGEFRNARVHTAALINLALVYDAQDMHEQALEYARQALPEANDLPLFASDAHLVMASVYRKRGDLVTAQSHVDMSRAHAASTMPPSINYNIEVLRFELMQAEGNMEGALKILEVTYERAIKTEQLSQAVRILDILRATHEQSGDKDGILSVYKRLSQDLPAYQQQMQTLRMQVLQMIFDRGRTTLESELTLNKQINRVLTRLSHEFRTPLTIIRNTSALIDMYEDQLTIEQRRSRLHKIDEQVDWMTTMLDDFQQLLAVEQDISLLMEIGAFTLDDLVKDVLKHMDRYKEVNSDRVRTVIEAEPRTVHGAYYALQTVLVQLLNNAVKFSQDKVTLKLHAGDEFLNIQVIDKGIGIPQTDQQAIFQPLIRGSNFDEVSGNGLGLALVKKLLRQMHGTIRIHSNEGTGTTVSLKVPLTG